MAEIDFKAFVKNIADGSDEARLALAQQLKKAGLWTGKVTSNLDAKYYAALTKLETAYKQQAAVDKIVGSQTPQGRFDVLKSLMAEGAGGGDGTSTTTATRYITSASQTSKLLDNVAQDLLGRKLTESEKKKYLKVLNKAQQENPTITTSGKGFSTTRGGIDEEAIITEQIGNTAEAKTNKATDAYSIMMEELGGLR